MLLPGGGGIAHQNLSAPKVQFLTADAVPASTGNPAAPTRLVDPGRRDGGPIKPSASPASTAIWRTASLRAGFSGGSLPSFLGQGKRPSARWPNVLTRAGKARGPFDLSASRCGRAGRGSC